MKLSNVCNNFSKVLKEFSFMKGMLKPHAFIVNNSPFDDATVMIQNGRAKALISHQREVVESLSKSSLTLSEQVSQSNRSASLLARARICRKKKDALNVNCYVDTRFLTLTSNVCKRLFSIVRFAIRERRFGISTKNFEAQLLLHCDENFWGVLVVSTVM